MSFTTEDYVSKAADLWAAFTPEERDLVPFGIVPAEKITAAEQEGYVLRPLVVALMQQARKSRLAAGHLPN